MLAVQKAQREEKSKEEATKDMEKKKKFLKVQKALEEAKRRNFQATTELKM